MFGGASGVATYKGAGGGSAQPHSYRSSSTPPARDPANDGHAGDPVM